MLTRNLVRGSSLKRDPDWRSRLRSRISAKMLKNAAPHYSLRTVEPEQANRDLASRTKRLYHRALNPKMLLPFFKPRIE